MPILGRRLEKRWSRTHFSEVGHPSHTTPDGPAFCFARPAPRLLRRMPAAKRPAAQVFEPHAFQGRSFLEGLAEADPEKLILTGGESAAVASEVRPEAGPESSGFYERVCASVTSVLVGKLVVRVPSPLGRCQSLRAIETPAKDQL